MDGIKIVMNEDGVWEEYDDTWDITIHCESEEEHNRAIEILKGGRWIPVSERLPEIREGMINSRSVLITVKDTVDESLAVCVGWYSNRFGWSWLDDGEVIAWMPLPEPYKEEVE